MVYESLGDLLIHGKSKTKKRLVIAAAEDLETIKAAVKGKKDGIIEPVLIGNRLKIQTLLTKLAEKPETYDIVPAKDAHDAASKAVAMIKAGDGDFLMKGHLDTAVLLKAVVNKETGIALSSTLSHVNLMEVAGYNKILVMTDVAIVIEPTLSQKKDIIQNSVEVLRKLGYEKPKVAVLCAVEKINPRMPETVEADALKQMNLKGELVNCLVEGPISFDIAMDKDRATRKSYDGQIKGDADILLVPNLVAGNLLAKGLSIFGGSKAVGFVAGAKVPIVLTSRGATAESKFNSIVTCLATL